MFDAVVGDQNQADWFVAFNMATRRSLFIPLCLCGVLVFSLTGCGAVWYLDPSAAEKIARKEKKPLLLYFKAWDSTQHRNFRLDVLSTAAVSAELKDTVNAELAFGFFGEFQRRCGVTQPHACVMCTSEGKPIGTKLSINPVPTKEKFLEWLGRMKAEAKATIPAVNPSP